MSNIFLLPPNLDKKERFAASWEYLLENIPDLGQDFVDFLTQRSGKPSSTFVKSVSHLFLRQASSLTYFWNVKILILSVIIAWRVS